jgi:hypothetical protein
MRNMSFMLTTEQVTQRKKFVTRRNGWKNIKVGQQIRAVKKCQGLKKGEKIEPLAIIRVISKRREPLNNLIYAPDYGEREIAKEGFLNMQPREFVQMYCQHNKCKTSDIITRIEFEYVL